MEKEKHLDTLANEEWKQLMDMSDCILFIVKEQPDFILQYANKKLYSTLQYTPEEFKEKFNNNLMEVIVKEEVQKIRALIARQRAAGGNLHLEFRIKRKDGTIRWISMTANRTMVRDKSVYYCTWMDITLQKRNLEDIYNAKKELDLITNSIPGGVIKLRISDYVVLYANDGFFRLAGYSRAEYLSLFGNQCNVVIHPDDAENVQRMIRTAVENRGSLSFEYRIVSKSGEVRWSYVNGCRVDDEDGEIVYLCVITDITARKKLEEKFRDSARRSKFLLKYMKETEWTYDVSEEKLYRTGYLEGTYSPLSEIENPLKEDYMESIFHPDDIELFEDMINERLRVSGQSRAIYRMKDSKGDYRSCEVSMISIGEKEEKPDKIYGETRFLDDHSFMIVNSKALKQKNEYVVEKVKERTKVPPKNEDTTTGLMSYDELIQKAQSILDKRRGTEHYGILCCDINEFSKLNYHYGISIGNEILQRLADVLQSELAYQKLCTRIKGDYFIVFFQYENHHELLKTMSRMLRVQTDLDEKQSYSTYGATSGIYLIQPEDRSSLDSMLEKADFARRSIKGIHGNHYAIYTEELQKNQFWEEEVIRDIGESMLNHTVEICYLPRIKGDKENVIGCKATSRIQLKDGTYMQLEDLRRYVDRSKEIQQMVFYVLSSVCANQGAWKAQGKKIMPISIDITPSQLCMQNAVAKINEIVEENKLSPSDIIFEIQEHYFKELSTNFQMALEDLRRCGYRVMISWFGSDHTAIHSLRHLPVSGIKFHGEFFHNHLKNEKEKIVLCKIVEMVKELGLTVCCGGLHTQLQEEFARSIGCDILEGDMYYGAVSNDVYGKCFLE
ncbi:MAG: EAL domain-containing protein [Butyribacter sp.]|nr:EAL domain-containing protein [Butyribacter sp.]